MNVLKFKPIIKYTAEDTIITLMLKAVRFISDDELKGFYDEFTKNENFWRRMELIEQYVTIKTGNEIIDSL